MKAQDTVVIMASAQDAVVPELVQMGQRLAQRKCELVGVERTAKHQRDDGGGRGGRAAGVDHLGQARGMMGAQLRNARVQACERAPVRRPAGPPTSCVQSHIRPCSSTTARRSAGRVSPKSQRRFESIHIAFFRVQDSGRHATIG